MQILSTSSLALSVALVNAGLQSTTPATHNANHIFNAVHSSMRQWGSSLLHNGMSVFIATVPEGTQLYHGTSEPYRVNATQWLAFEPEHALVFARAHHGPPPGKGGLPKPGDEQEGWHPPQSIEALQEYPPEPPPKHELEARHPHEPANGRPLSHTRAQRKRASVYYKQEPLQPKESKVKNDQHGYLHTYRAKHDLRLLYLDGQSAAKSTKGTLDMQDLVLLHDNPPPADGRPRQPPHDQPGSAQDPRSRRSSDQRPKDKKPRTGGPMSEGYRADHLCAMAENEWTGKIDGFLRMELGFEIILCSFERDLDIERITEAKESYQRRGPPGHGDGSINYYQAVASRFDNIGGDRVSIDYENFVTLYAFDNAVSFDENGLPRANNDTKVLQPVQQAIKEMTMPRNRAGSTNWQAIADMVIARYSDRIETLAAGNFAHEAAFKLEMENAVRPFIDYGNRNITLEIERCATQYFPALPPSTSIAAQAVLDVTTHTCASLLDAATESYSEALMTVKSLKTWLGWTTFKRCRGCSYNEVCFVPIWPMGGQGDYDEPKCVSNMSEVSNGYWGDMGGPPPPPSRGRNWI
ncbi:hypothetical protein Slin15195_G107110 [Septoria linicola]|uniref:Uncharacterized protein n=1 Tax=Septoria linicola TaxID=215465 RepID=A0A9Q9EP74_9PEZI|nr:hypothetical protein Slin14017_G070080 [Septoria linicola]USW57392.1 hypothetical protein Slin15195_G107110 [Septoria linicola]